MSEYNIPVLLGSVRDGRRSDKVAEFLANRLNQQENVNSKVLDLLEYDLPVMKERLRMMENPPENIVNLGKELEAADGLIIVSPEYNHSIPGVLKNAFDFYSGKEFSKKAVGLAVVSAGSFGGARLMGHLQNIVLTFGAIPIPTVLNISAVHKLFETANPDDERFLGFSEKFVEELLWYTEAFVNQKQKSQG